MNRRSVLVWSGQIGLAILVGYFIWQSLVQHWQELRGWQVDLEFRVGALTGAFAVVLAVYAVLIAAWRAVLAGWLQWLAFVVATRIWCLANLGRYLPGKVWSIAGLAAMAQREGVSPWASVGSALTMQLLSIASGIVLVAITVPAAASAMQFVIAGAVVASVLAALVSPKMGTWVTGLLGRDDYEFHALPVRVVVAGLIATAIAWVGYGLAFLLLVRGLVPGTTLPFITAIGVFAAGYIVGFLALFAPGGLGVREAVYTAMLAPSLGVATAIAVSVASRLLLTGTEIVAALIGLTLARGRHGRTATGAI